MSYSLSNIALSLSGTNSFKDNEKLITNKNIVVNYSKKFNFVNILRFFYETDKTIIKMITKIIPTITLMYIAFLLHSVLLTLVAPFLKL